MMHVKLCSAVYSQISYRKTLAKCYFPDTILKQFWYCFNDYECTHHNFGTQINSLYKLVSVRKGSLFLGYENW